MMGCSHDVGALKMLCRITFTGAWWHTPVIPVVGVRSRRIVSSRAAWATYADLVSNKQKIIFRLFVASVYER
jgi:hypothetical protein